MSSCEHIRMKLTLFGRFKCRDCGERFDLEQLVQMTERLNETTNKLRALMPKKRTIDTKHEYDQNTFNKGFNHAIKLVDRIIKELEK